MRFLLLISLLALSACAKKSEVDLIATIGDLELSQQEFEYAFTDFYNRTGRAINVNDLSKQQILGSEVNRLAVVQYALDEGISELPRNILEKERIRQKVVINRVINDLYLDTLRVSEQEVRQLFYDFNTYVRASHLYAGSYSEAVALKERVEQGESFESIAKEVFSTPYLANNGGDLGFFTVDEMDIMLEKAAFRAKKGDVVGPVRTSTGFSVVKVTDKSIRPLITEFEYANQKARFESFAMDQKRRLFRRKYLEDFSSNTQLDQVFWQQLVAAFEADKQAFIRGDGEWSLDFNTSNDIKYKGEALDIDWINAAFRVSTQNERARVDSEEALRDFVIGLAFRAYHLSKEKSLSQEDKAYIAESFKRTWHAHLQKEVRDEVLVNLELPDDSLRAFYNKDPRLFDAELELNLKRIRTRTKSEAEQATKKLKAGEDFLDVLSSYTMSNEDLIMEGALGWMPISSFGTLAQKLKDIQEGDIVGPLEFQSGEWLVFVCEGRKDSHPQSFEAAKEQVEAAVLGLWHQRAMNALIEKTKQKHNVWMDMEKLYNLNFSHLQ